MAALRRISVVAALLAAGAAGAAEPPRAFTLDDCLQHAQRRRPKLIAARAMVAKADLQAAEAERLRGRFVWLRPDLEFRAKQACLGAQAARWQLAKQEAEARYSVTRTYWSVAYARRMSALADDSVRRLDGKKLDPKDVVGGRFLPEELFETAQELLAGPRMGAKELQATARIGTVSALAALRQALGEDAAFALEIASSQLPEPVDPGVGAAELRARIERGNPDLAAARLLAEVHALETKAQDKIKSALTADTFAASGDLHAAATPPEGIETYRPSPIVPEMPVRLAGSRAVRVAVAGRYAEKAAEMARGIRNLLELQATVAVEIAVQRRMLYLETQGKNDLAAAGLVGLQAHARRERLRAEYLLSLLELERLAPVGGDQPASCTGSPANRPAAPPAGKP